jgi:putative transposase
VALRQLAVYKRKEPRPRLSRFDCLFWVVVRRIWADWSEALILVKPDTVVSWHRAGYRLFWRWKSRRQRLGRPKVAEEVRVLIRRMKRENPMWGAPRIHGDLLLLGFEISELTVPRYLQHLKRTPEESKASQWLAFLNNHRQAIAAFDFLTVPTLRFAPYTASSRLNTVAGAFCISTLPSIQQAIGSCTSYGKHSRFPAPIDTCCSTMMPSSEMTS